MMCILDDKIMCVYVFAIAILHSNNAVAKCFTYISYILTPTCTVTSSSNYCEYFTCPKFNKNIYVLTNDSCTMYVVLLSSRIKEYLL